MYYSDSEENNQLFPTAVRKALTAVNQLRPLKPSPSPNQEKCLLLSSKLYKVNNMTECLGGKEAIMQLICINSQNCFWVCLYSSQKMENFLK